MKFAYYPGCSLHATAVEFDTSTKAVCSKIGVELVEIPDWNCCGASSAHNTSPFLSSAIPARNLIKAEELGLDVTAPCAACYQRLKAAQQDMRNNPRLQDAMKEIMGQDYHDSIDVKTIVEVIARNFNADTVVKPLQGLKVVCYYGCLMVKPPKVTQFDNPENPTSMDELMAQLGAEVLPWPYKTECCGGSLPFYNEDPTLKLMNDILRIAKDSGAHLIVTACPLCMSNLDMRQANVEQKYNVKYNIPVVYFTELAGLAMGIKAGDLGLTNKHFKDPMGILGSLGLV